MSHGFHCLSRFGGPKENVQTEIYQKQLVVQKMASKTYPPDCRKIAAVDSHNSIGIERKQNQQKIDFCIKTFLTAIYFDVIL